MYGKLECHHHVQLVVTLLLVHIDVLAFGKISHSTQRPMIPSLIRPAIPPSPTSPESPEDIFSSTPGLIFTDDTRNQHGDPGSGVIYKNGVFGDIELQLVDPNKEDERRLFAHYVWNAGILLSELVAGRREWDLEGSGEVGEQDGEGEGAGKEVGRIRQSVEFKVYSWSVKGETVLELGAGG